MANQRNQDYFAVITIVVIVSLFCIKITENYSIRDLESSHSSRHKRADQEEGDQLVFSTMTDINHAALTAAAGSGMSATNFAKVLTEKNYIIGAFSVSFQENLVMYGIDTIYVSPIGPGSNFMNIQSKKSLNIQFEKNFAVDWVDRNVYAFRDRKIIIHRLDRGGQRTIYNASRSVRNIVIEHNKHFIAWISNDNNIVKAAKDGSEQITVFTAETKIHCMTFEPNSERFFFYVSQKSTPKNRKEEPLSVSVLYSIDYAGKYQAIREGSVVVRSANATPAQIAKYYDSTFVMMQEINSRGDAAYMLGQAMRDGTLRRILLKDNWRITSVQVAWRIRIAKKLCTDYQLSYCPSICVHRTDDEANCVCPDNSACNSYLMTPPTTQSETGSTEAPESMGVFAGNVADNFFPIVGTIISIVVIAMVCYFAYKYMFVTANDEPSVGAEGEEGSLSKSGSISAGGTPAVASAQGSQIKDGAKAGSGAGGDQQMASGISNDQAKFAQTNSTTELLAPPPAPTTCFGMIKNAIIQLLIMLGFWSEPEDAAQMQDMQSLSQQQITSDHGKSTIDSASIKAGGKLGGKKAKKLLQKHESEISKSQSMSISERIKLSEKRRNLYESLNTLLTDGENSKKKTKNNQNSECMSRLDAPIGRGLLPEQNESFAAAQANAENEKKEKSTKKNDARQKEKSQKSMKKVNKKNMEINMKDGKKMLQEQQTAGAPSAPTETIIITSSDVSGSSASPSVLSVPTAANQLELSRAKKAKKLKAKGNDKGKKAANKLAKAKKIGKNTSSTSSKISSSSSSSFSSKPGKAKANLGMKSKKIGANNSRVRGSVVEQNGTTADDDDSTGKWYDPATWLRCLSGESNKSQNAKTESNSESSAIENSIASKQQQQPNQKKERKWYDIFGCL